ncbi:MAG TPA: beta-N-acetylhexosaminidase [Micromonosporaceae bacterium]
MDSPPWDEAITRPDERPLTPRPRSAPDPPATRLAGLVPAPVAVHPTGETYHLSAETVIAVDTEAARVGRYLAELLRPATGYPLPVVSGAASPPRPAAIALRLTGADPAVGTEGYELEVGAAGVALRARTDHGLFNGVQTLRQLLPAAIERPRVQPGPWTAPGGRILDYPRFAYRGAMLDVARHFFPVPAVKRYVDELAHYKINHLHLHLTDDQGWRIAVESWPKLATIGGAGEVGGGPGGYYTAQQYAEIVTYAAARHITVVPEIDMPGHVNAALTAYPDLTRDGVAPPPYLGTDVGFSALAVDREPTYGFVADVIAEIAARTPGPYLHIGGDEAWTLTREEYTAFMNRAQAIVAETGKTVMGWHQLAVADHVPGRVLQFWGTSPEDPSVAEAVRRGARVVLSPGNRTYLDMKYTPQTRLGKDWAGCVDVREAYDWDPAAYLIDVPAAAVLGVEAPLWTETVTTLAEAEYLTFPRLPAIAELGWSPAAAHDWDDFRHRLATHAPRWVNAGIAFHPSPQIPWPMSGTRAPAAEVPAQGSRPDTPTGRAAAQPPDSSSSAPSGTPSASRSANQPSGR